jgi:hypothetical protein
MLSTRVLTWKLFGLLLLTIPQSLQARCPDAGFSNPVSATAVIHTMLETIRQSQQFSYKMKAWERFGDEMIYTESDVKLQTRPLKIYMKTWAPESGIEVLYEEDARNGMALVRPNGFPYMSVKLSPMSSRMRSYQHHTLRESGFSYFGDLISRNLKQHGHLIDRYVSLEDAVQWNNRDCYLLTIDNPSYAWEAYTVRPGEDLVAIARKLGIPEHSVLERNSNIKSYSDLKAGQVIRVPNTYSKKTVLYIDKSNNLPIKKMIYDDMGLYEVYEFHYLNTAPRLGPEAFDSSNPEYSF